MSELMRLSFSIEEGLYTKLEELVESKGYENRSEFIRDLVRDKIVEEEWGKDEEGVGSITIVFDHHYKELTQRLTNLQHDYHEAILFSTHVHLDHKMCAETILVRGNARKIEKISNSLRQLKGVYHASLSLSSLGAKIG